MKLLDDMADKAISMTTAVGISAVAGGQSMSRRCAADTDAALSLCALACTSRSSIGSIDTNPQDYRPFLVNDKAKPIHTGSSIGYPSPVIPRDGRAATVTPTISLSSSPTSLSSSPIGQRAIQDLTAGCSVLSMNNPPDHPSIIKYDILSLLPKKKSYGPKKQTQKKQAATKVSVTSPSPRKNNMKPKDPKRDTSVTFDEMKRLMRVYGPIKALRNRSSKDADKAPAKPESIRRKFYRWFPDFNDRFVKTDAGYFTPKVGHLQEMQYREDMRKKDQELLVKKRIDKRYNTMMFCT